MGTEVIDEADTLIVAAGVCCCQQIKQGTRRQALHGGVVRGELKAGLIY